MVGVEALTLPYSDGRFEVACNMLEVGKGGSVEKIDRRLDEWVQGMVIEHRKGKGVDEEIERQDFVDDAYRVGTTVDQCLEVLCVNKDEGAMEMHDGMILDRLRGYLVH